MQSQQITEILCGILVPEPVNDVRLVENIGTKHSAMVCELVEDVEVNPFNFIEPIFGNTRNGFNVYPTLVPFIFYSYPILL